MDSALSIDPGQPKHAAQAYQDRHFLPPVDFLFQEISLYTPVTECVEQLACMDCAGSSGSIHCAETITLNFSWNGSLYLLSRSLNIFAYMACGQIRLLHMCCTWEIERGLSVDKT